MLLTSTVWLDNNIKRPEVSVFLKQKNSLLEEGIEGCRKTCFSVSLIWRNCGKLYKTFSTSCSWCNDFPQQEIGVERCSIKILIYHCKSIQKDSVKVIFPPC